MKEIIGARQVGRCYSGFA